MKGYVFKGDPSGDMGEFFISDSASVGDFHFCLNDFIDSGGGNACTGQHDRNHGQHQERHDDKHGISDKCNHISDLKISEVDAFRPLPDDED